MFSHTINYHSNHLYTNRTPEHTFPNILPLAPQHSQKTHISTHPPHSSSPESTYDLYAVLSHDGINANSGHYTALIYSNNHIIKCNDQHVCIVGDSFLSPAVQTALRGV